ncbi:MAG: MopE-related protein [Myxococcota bacterium]
MMWKFPIAMTLLLALVGCGDNDKDSAEVVDSDGDGFDTTQDCDDANASVFPGASEVCDGLDNDCDEQVDNDPVDGDSYYTDADGDGFGDPSVEVISCTRVDGSVENNTDCNDGSAFANPEAAEICDGIDNDCDELVDDDDSSLNPATTGTFYFLDSDGDSFGDIGERILTCAAPAGYVEDSTDCNDDEATANPGAPEICDEIDNDCDTLVDDADDSLDGSTGTNYYEDLDADGFGNLANLRQTCIQPAGFVVDSTDCNDNDNTTFPAATELCDGQFNDCNNGDFDITAAPPDETDDDGDFYIECTGYAPGVTVTDEDVVAGDDCNDAEAGINPAAQEICDEADVDEDCDTFADDADDSTSDESKFTYYADADEDAFGSPDNTTLACAVPEGFVVDNTDCDDTRDFVNPDGSEICDDLDLDEDCNGAADDADTGVDPDSFNTFYFDADLDEYGDDAVTEATCDPSEGYIAVGGDCDETRDDVNPGADEVCDDDDVDEDCDDVADDLDSSTTDASKTTFFADTDNDTFGDAESTDRFCALPETGYSVNDTDCDDGAADVNPAAEETYGGDTIDKDCNGLIGLGVADLVEDDLIITEFMPNPGIIADDDGEWFEIYNNTNEELNLIDLELSDLGSDDITVTDDVLVAPDTYVVFSIGDTDTSELPAVDFVYTGFTLANEDDEIILGYTDAEGVETIIDQVAYTSSWSFDSDVAASLNGPRLTRDNSDITLWCEAEADYFTNADGDSLIGSPGEANPICPGTVEDCEDDINDDGDGLIDCEDDDCLDFCAEDCTDEIDNDDDSFTDCEDDECYGVDGCAGPYNIEYEVRFDEMYFKSSYYYYGDYTTYTYIYDYNEYAEGYGDPSMYGGVELTGTPDGWLGASFSCEGSFTVDFSRATTGSEFFDDLVTFDFEPNTADGTLTWSSSCPVPGLPTATLRHYYGDDYIERRSSAGSFYTQYYASSYYANNNFSFGFPGTAVYFYDDYYTFLYDVYPSSAISFDGDYYVP